jgi:hypothetical protein
MPHQPAMARADHQAAGLLGRSRRGVAHYAVARSGAKAGDVALVGGRDDAPAEQR